MGKTIYTFLFIFFFLSGRAQKSATDSLSCFNWGVLPSAYYTPETSIGLGGLAYTNFKASHCDTSSRKSNTQSYFSYTFNRQFSFENDYQLWFLNNKLYFSGSADFTRFPEFFFGLGNNTKWKERELISFNLIKVNTRNLFMFNKNWYLGAIVNFQKLYDLEGNLEKFNECANVHGINGYMATGLGPVLVYDSRNNPLNPSKGAFLELSFTDYSNKFFNKHGFYMLLMDARKYTTLFQKLIWNGNLYVAHSHGQVPFRMLPELGGARFLRGIYRGRFREMNKALLQQEVRFNVYRFLGLAFFNGLGVVAADFKDLRTETLHHNYGAGLRIRLNKSDNANLRIDYGLTKTSRGLYIVYAEAF